jgi:hypothetical protein
MTLIKVHISAGKLFAPFIIGIFLFIYSCGTQNQLKKTWMNQSETKLQESFGSPVTVIDRENDKVMIFEKQEELRSTEISQGRLTLDPIITPKVMKTERYTFTVQNGIITGTKFEEKYERY